MSNNWTKDVNIQPSPSTLRDFQAAQDSFAEQEYSSKGLQKTLENLFLTSNKLRLKTESVKTSLQHTTPRAEGALNQMDVNPISVNK